MLSIDVYEFCRWRTDGVRRVPLVKNLKIRTGTSVRSLSLTAGLSGTVRWIVRSSTMAPLTVKVCVGHL